MNTLLNLVKKLQYQIFFLVFFTVFNLGTINVVRLLFATINNDSLSDVLFFLLVSNIIFVIVFSIVYQFFASLFMRSLNTLASLMKRLTSGNPDLTQRFENKKSFLRNEIDEIGDDFNIFTGKLREIILFMIEHAKKNHGNIQSLYDSSEDFKQITLSVREIAEGLKADVNNDSEAIARTSNQINAIVKSLEDFAKNIKILGGEISQTFSILQEMLSRISSVESNMKTMSTEFDALSSNSKTSSKKAETLYDSIRRLTDSSNGLISANQVIAKISANTSLLAMNAAIEAAHAGDYGRGFSVVAEEIRQLADMSAKESKLISNIIKDFGRIIRDVEEGSVSFKSDFSRTTESISDISAIQQKNQLIIQEQAQDAIRISELVRKTMEVTSGVSETSSLMTGEANNITLNLMVLGMISEKIKLGISRIDEQNEKVSDHSKEMLGHIDAIVSSTKQINGLIGQFQVK